MIVKTMVSVALIVLFAGCAGYGNGYGNGYRDGAYYHPSRGDEGDYYYGRPPVKRGYYNPYYGPYGAPFYYSPYPYYRPYRYRPYYGPFRSSYYGSGFGASYAYGGFSGYRDAGHSYFGRFTYRDHDRHDRRARYDRYEHDRSERNRGDRRNQRSNRFDGAPISNGRYRRDTLPGRRGNGIEPRVFERRITQPTSGLHDAPEQPVTVRLQPDGGRIVQMRRVDNAQSNGKKRFRPQPEPGPARTEPASVRTTLRSELAPTNRGVRVERQLQARERNTTIQPTTRSSPQVNSSQRRLNEQTRNSGNKTRNTSQLKNSVDTVDE